MFYVFLQFGIVDADGALSLWQTSTSGNTPKPYLVKKKKKMFDIHFPCITLHMHVSLCQTLQCHNKTAHDFVFVGSSSLIATAGLSTDNRYQTCLLFSAQQLKAGSFSFSCTLTTKMCWKGWTMMCFVFSWPQKCVSLGHSSDSCQQPHTR